MKLNTHNLSLFLLLTVIFIAGTGIGYVFSTSSSTFTISSGTYPSGYSYTVYKEGTTYYAKNAYGYLTYSGTNATQIIMQTIKNDSSTFLTSNIFILTSPIVISNIYNFTLTGCGTATRLKMTALDSVIKILGTAPNNLHYVTIENIFIEGYHGVTPSSVKSDIYANYNYKLTIRHITIFASAGNGIKIENSVIVLINDILLTDVIGNGIWFLAVGDSIITNVKVFGCFYNGLFLQTCGAITISASHFDTNAQRGIHCYDAAHIIIDGCSVYDNDYLGTSTYQGIFIDGSTYTTSHDIIISDTIVATYASICLCNWEIYLATVNRTTISTVSTVGNGAYQAGGIGVSSYAKNTHVTASWNVTASGHPVWISSYP